MKSLALALTALAVFVPVNAAMAGSPTAVPEPASLTLMAVGVAGALIASRFRKK